MRNLVAKYGVKAVWDAGIKVVGFPATWIEESASADAIAAELEREKGT